MATHNNEASSNDAVSSSSNENKPHNADEAFDKEAKKMGIEPHWERPNPFAQNSGDKKREITEDECEGQLGYHYPSWKKWTILSVIFTVQVSMNFNTSLYSNNLKNITHK